MNIIKWFGAKGKRKAEKEEEDNPASIFNAALSLHESGRFLDAYPLYIEALKGFEFNLEKDPDNSLLQSYVAGTRNNLGCLLGSGVMRYADARRMYEKLLKNNPENTQLKSYVATVTVTLVNLRSDMDCHEEARRMYADAQRMYEKLLKNNPENTQLQSGVATTQNNLGILLSDRGRQKEVRKMYACALEVYELYGRLWKSDPESIQSQFYTAAIRDNLVILRSDIGWQETTRMRFAAALEEYEQLTNRESMQIKSYVATNTNDLRVLLRVVDRQEEARRMYAGALERHEQLLNIDPENTQFQSDAATTQNNLGILLGDMSRQEEVRKMYATALEMCEQHLNIDPENTQFQSDAATTQNNFGILLCDMGRQEEARKRYAAALGLYKKLRHRDPENTQFQSFVAMTQNNFGILLCDMGRQEEARKRYASALGLYEQLLNRDPESTQFQSFVATIQNNFGILLSDMGQQEEARKMYAGALGLYEQLLNRDPENTQFQSFVAMTQNNFGILLSERGRHEEAKERHERALELVKGQRNLHYTGWTLSLLGRLDLERDAPDLETARSFLESSIEKLHKDIRPHYPNALNWLALCYYKLGEEKKKEARKEQSQDRAKVHVSESARFFALSCSRYKEAYELPYARMPDELLIDAYMADTFASSVQIISEEDDQTAVDILDKSIAKIEYAVRQAKDNEAQRLRIEGVRHDLLAKKSIRSVSLFKDEKDKQEFYLADAIDNFINAAQNFEEIESEKTVASCQGCACLYTGLKKFKEGVMSDKVKMIADAGKEFKKASSFYQSAASEVGEEVISSINEVIAAIKVYYDELNISLNEGRKPGTREYEPVYNKISDLIEHVSAFGLRNLFKVYIFDDVMNLVDEKEPKQKKVEVIMGDKFENIHNATIVNRSVVVDSFNKLKESYDVDVANALVQIAEFIEISGNTEAGKLFDSFYNEIKKPEPEKSVLKSLWGGIEKALPAITAVSEAVVKLKTIFG